MAEIMDAETVTARTAARRGVVVALLTLPVAILVDHFDPGRGTAAWASIALMIGAVRVFWYLRRHAWFWMTIALLAIIHVVLIVLVPWSNKSFPAPELWPVGIVDFVAICGFIKLVEKAMSRGRGASSPA